MNMWSILKINKTADKSAIKKAYRSILKDTRPDDDEKAFMELREAYEEALEYAENYDEDIFDEDIFEDEYDEDILEEDIIEEDIIEEDIIDEDILDDDYEEYETDNDSFMFKEDYCDPEILDEINRRGLLKQWECQVVEALNDIEKIKDTQFWINFLYDSIAYKLRYFDECKYIIHKHCLDGEKACLTDEVWKVLDNFFELSPQGIAPNLNEEKIYRSNEYAIKLNDKIDFDMFYNVKSKDIQTFCWCYNDLISLLMANNDCEDSKEKIVSQIYRLRSFELAYVPFECINLAYNFSNDTLENVQRKIGNLKKMYGTSIYTELLDAQYFIYANEYGKAKEIFIKIYKDVPLKNYVFIYQMAVCLKKVGMYFESYMLVKQLTWLNPQEFMYDMAKELYEDMKKEYDEKISLGESIDDIKHIEMCRLYLRTYNMRKKAEALLEQVHSSRDNLWQYNIAKILCIFCSGEVTGAEECFSELKSYDISGLSNVDVLEYEELKLRYLLMQGKYKECMAGCDKLLNEYPLSYPVLMIKSYADYADYDNKQFSGLNWLYYAIPQRVEAALPLIRQGGRKNAWYFTESHETECTVEDRYYKIMRQRDNDNSQTLHDLLELCKYIRDNEVSIDDHSPFDYLDLYGVYDAVLDEIKDYHNITWQDVSKYYDVLESMAASKYNHPEKYANLVKLYVYAAKDNDLEKVLENKKVPLPKKESDYSTILVPLVDRYGRTNNVEKLKALEKEVDKLSLKDNEMKWIYENFYVAYNNMNDLESAEKYALKCIECGLGMIQDYFSIIQLYKKINEKKYLKKAIAIYKKAIATCGKIGDVGRGHSIYPEVAYIYAYLGDFDNAKKCLDNILKYSKNNVIRDKYHFYLSVVYECLEEYDKAYEAFEQYEKENQDEDFGSIKLYVMYKAERFDDMYSYFLKSIEEDEDREYNKESLSYIIHTLYLKNQCVDIELVKEYYQCTKNTINNIEKAKNGINYIVLAEFCNILNKNDECEYYENLAKETQWEDINLKRKFMARLEVWKIMYQQKWEEAYEYLEKMDGYIRYNYFELEGLFVCLKKRLKKTDIL